MRGLFDCHRVEVYFCPSQYTTFPASSMSLSNHVCHNPPPYVITWNWPKLLKALLETGAILRHGLSVWAPMILKAVLEG